MTLSAGGAGGFPDPPKGSPGGIRSAARALKTAGHDLDEVATGLMGATGALEADWNGDAAGRYRGASQGLTSVARAAAQTFVDCARAVDDYADALEHARNQIAKLKVAYDEATGREATAQGQAQRFAGQLLTAHPNAVSGLESQIASAGSDAQSAAGDATHIAHHAHQVVDDFRREERRASGVLSGQRVPRGGGLAGGFAGPGLSPASGVGNGLAPGFGVPLAGLAPFNGVVSVGDPWNSDIPGLGYYWDSKHGAVQPTNDLTNLIVFAAGGVSVVGVRALGLAARELASGAGERLGLSGGRAVADRAGQQAFDETLAGGARSESLRTRLIGARGAGSTARAEGQVAFQGRRAETVKNALEIARKFGVKVPDGAPELVRHLVQSGAQYRYYALARLLSVRALLVRRGTPVALRAARTITRFVGPPRP